MIEKITINLERWVYQEADGTLQELRIDTMVNGKDYHSRQILKPDDFQSIFDVIWNAAYRELQIAIQQTKDD